MITTLSEKLKERGILPTPQRLAVYAALAGRCDHPGVDRVFQDLRRKLPSLSKTTVYSTMQLLAAKGLVGCVHVDGEEVRYDGRAEFHAHFRCRTCGKIYDILPDEAGARPFVRLPKGFEIDNEELTYYGICPNCKSKKRPTKKGKAK